MGHLALGVLGCVSALVTLTWLVRRGHGTVQFAWPRMLLVSLMIGVGAGLTSVVVASWAWGAAAGGALLSLSALRVWRLVGFTELCERLGDSDERAATLLRIDRELEALRPDPDSANSWAPYVHRALYAVAAMVNHDLVEDAERVLASLPRLPLTPELEAQRAQYQAVLLLRRGDLRAARATLASAPVDLEDLAMGQALDATGALLLALEGRSDEAQLRIAALGEPLHPHIAATLRYARVHALAVSDPDEARTLIEEVWRTHGRTAVERIRRNDGPASALCDEILQEHVGPYR